MFKQTQIKIVILLSKKRKEKQKMNEKQHDVINWNSCALEMSLCFVQTLLRKY